MSGPGSKDIWVCVSFDMDQEGEDLMCVPLFRPGTPARPGGAYPWIGRHAGRILLDPGDAFNVMVLALYQPAEPPVSGTPMPLISAKLVDCVLKFDNTNDSTDDSPFSPDRDELIVSSWTGVQEDDKEWLEARLRELATFTFVEKTYHCVWQIGRHNHVVRNTAGVWQMSLILTAEVTRNGKCNKRKFRFDPECQVGTGTASAPAS